MVGVNEIRRVSFFAKGADAEVGVAATAAIIGNTAMAVASAANDNGEEGVENESSERNAAILAETLAPVVRCNTGKFN